MAKIAFFLGFASVLVHVGKSRTGKLMSQQKVPNGKTGLNVTKHPCLPLSGATNSAVDEPNIQQMNHTN